MPSPPALSPSAVVGDALSLYGRFWKHFAGVGVTIFFTVAIAALLLSFAGVAGLVIASVISLAGSIVLTGALVTAVSDARDGRIDLSVGETISRAWPFILPLLGAGILASIGLLIGFILLIIPGLILMTFWFVIGPCIVLERTGVLDAFSASRRYVRGHAWTVFGVALLSLLVVVIAGAVVGVVLAWLPVWLSQFLTTLVQGAVFAPFYAIVVTLTYFALSGARDDEVTASRD